MCQDNAAVLFFMLMGCSCMHVLEAHINTDPAVSVSLFKTSLAASMSVCASAGCITVSTQRGEHSSA
jgi:hypothetical protein